MKFKDLSIGARFIFTGEKEWLSMAKGPWIKLSARKYRHVEDPDTEHRVGSISAEVEDMPSPFPG